MKCENKSAVGAIIGKGTIIGKDYTLGSKLNDPSLWGNIIGSAARDSCLYPFPSSSSLSVNNYIPKMEYCHISCHPYNQPRIPLVFLPILALLCFLFNDD